MIIKCLNYETRFFKRFINVEMLYFIYKSRVEYTSAREYVDFIYWLKNIFFNQFDRFLLSESSKLRKWRMIRFEFSDENENESEIWVDRVIIENKIQISSRCEIFARSIAIAFCWFLIDRDIIWLRHNQLRFNERARKFNERLRRFIEHEQRFRKQWFDRIRINIILIVRFYRCCSKFRRFARCFDHCWLIFNV